MTCPNRRTPMNHSWAAPSRRGLIGAGAGLAAGAAAQLLAGKAEAARGMATLDQLKRAERDPDHRILLRGGIVLSFEPGIRQFAAVGPAYRRGKMTSPP